jgi:uncharacterized protein (TIGR01777 family)
MKIVIAGGSGFLGKALAKHWINEDVFILSRNKKLLSEPNYIYWDAKNLSDWVNVLENADLLINLSGKSVNCRYTEKSKTTIISSRVNATRVLDVAVSQCENPPKVWMNASSATIYRHALDRPMTELKGDIGEGFSVEVCKAWEKGFFSHSLFDTRKVALRTALVFGKEGSTYPVFKSLVYQGLGGTQGLGNQFVSWIHIQDFIRAIEFIYEKKALAGIVNICAPNPTPNADFMKGFRKSLKMPFGLRLYPWMVKIGAFMKGTEAELILKSRRVIPERLLNEGFDFKFKTVGEALGEISNSHLIVR